MIDSDGSEGSNYKRPDVSKELRIGTWNVLTLYKYLKRWRIRG